MAGQRSTTKLIRLLSTSTLIVGIVFEIAFEQVFEQVFELAFETNAVHQMVSTALNS